MGSGVYKIRNIINEKIYIGSTVDIDKRWRKHFSELRTGRHHNIHLQSAWNKYGADNFEFSIIEECFPFVLIFREQHYINILKPEYNIRHIAGSHIGKTPSEEVRKKISISKLGNKARLGHKHSQFSKDKMSAAKRKKLSQEIKDAMSLARKGRKHTQETKEKMSIARIGNTNTLGKRWTQKRTGKRYEKKHIESTP